MDDNLPHLDPFQDVLPLPVADDEDDARGISITVNVPSRVKDDFVNIKDVEDDDGEEIYDWEHYEEEDVNFDCSAFNILIGYE